MISLNPRTELIHRERLASNVVSHFVSVQKCRDYLLVWLSSGGHLGFMHDDDIYIKK